MKQDRWPAQYLILSLPLLPSEIAKLWTTAKKSRQSTKQLLNSYSSGKANLNNYLEKELNNQEANFSESIATATLIVFGSSLRKTVMLSSQVHSASTSSTTLSKTTGLATSAKQWLTDTKETSKSRSSLDINWMRLSNQTISSSSIFRMLERDSFKRPEETSSRLWLWIASSWAALMLVSPVEEKK